MGLADGHSRNKNGTDDCITPFPCVRALLDNVNFANMGRILDPCCGTGVFGKIFKEYGIKIIEKDIRKGNDFYKSKARYDVIIANPPYSHKDNFIEKAFECATNIFMILPMTVVSYNNFHKNFLDNKNYIGRWLMTPKFFIGNEETERPKRGGISAYAWFYWSFSGQRSKDYSFERYIDLNEYGV